ncbi:hypothetical protein JG687_00001413 [Phytophthora cactorum]|uniref:SGNH hydrolase-type esterase domain-containing protein n=1 Tax=Phytophthora cactorum TaxID=29920 RepID=A0A8T1UXE7_9STRA|nr:hypothetical protein JG687_00001413 [Phytophthora cactorum]
MIPTPIKPTKHSPLFTLPGSFSRPSINAKRTLLACFALVAYIAWSLGVWEALLIESGLRPKLRPTVLLVGDSLTEKGTNPKANGWVTLLQNDYTRSANVVPRGLSGYNTRWKHEGDKKGVIDRTNEMAGKYAQVCVETAYKLGLPVVNLYSYFNDTPKWRRNNMLGDGLHLNTRGNKLMYDQLMDKIKSEFPDVVHKLERWQLPSFSKLVQSDPWVPDDTDEDTNSTLAIAVYCRNWILARLGVSLSSIYTAMASPPEKPKLPSPSPPPALTTRALISKPKRILLALFAVAAYIAWSFSAWEAILERTSIRPQLRPVMVLVGDSLTEKGTMPKNNGWVTLLQSDYRRSVNVVPRGLSGYNTKWYLKYGVPSIQGEISSGVYMPTLITIWLGANDAALPNGTAMAQHVPVESYKENLVLLVLSFQTMAPDAGILLITPPYVDDKVQQKNARKYKGDKKDMVAHSNTMAGIYARACVEMANKLKLPVLDLHTYFNNMTEWERKNVLEDGLHLNMRGNNFMYQQLRLKIDAEFPNVSHKLDRWQIPSYETWIEADPWFPDDDNRTRDSLTEKGLIPSSMGWATMLQSDCRRTVDVVSRGLAGYNTKWYLKHAMPIVQDEIIGHSYSPILITIWLGANDAALPDGSSSESHIPIDEYQDNLAKLVIDFQAITPTSRILLITPPYVDDAVQKRNAEANEGDKKGLIAHSNEMAGKYARACVDTAKRVGVPVLDLHTYFNSLSKRKRKDLLEDGLHFNTTGNALMYEKLREIIESEFEDVAQKLEHWQFPHFEDFVETDPWTPDSTTVDFTNVREGTDPDLGGWVAQLQHRYTRSADVVVRGLYGYSTEIFVKHALPNLRKDLSSWPEPPAFVAVWLGGNDSALLSGYEAALHVPIPKYRANLREIVQTVQEEAPDAAILMITPPAVNDRARHQVWSDPDGELDFSNDGVGEYARACMEEAESLGVSVLDFHTIMNELHEQERCACQYDGLHFNQKGNELVIGHVLAAIEREFPSLAKRLDAWEHPDYLELLGNTDEN